MEDTADGTAVIKGIFSLLTRDEILAIPPKITKADTQVSTRTTARSFRTRRGHRRHGHFDMRMTRRHASEAPMEKRQGGQLSRFWHAVKGRAPTYRPTLTLHECIAAPLQNGIARCFFHSTLSSTPQTFALNFCKSALLPRAFEQMCQCR